MAVPTPDPERARPIRRDVQRNHERILAAATRLFAERGVGTSLDDVAEVADVGVGTVYRHFPNKDALLDELFETAIAELATYAESALSYPDPWEAFTGLLEHLTAAFADNRALVEVVLHSNRGEQRIARARDNLQAPIQRIVERAKSAGALPPDFEPEDIGLIQTMLAAVINQTHTDTPQLWRRYLEIIVDGLAHQADAASRSRRSGT